MKSTKKLNLLCLAIATISLSACGNYGAGRAVATEKKEEAKNTTRSTSTTENTGDYQCPSSPQVEPRYDEWLNGSNFYKVCTKKDVESDLKVHGKTATSDTVCVFPAQVTQSQGGVALLDPSGVPIYTCTKAQAAADGSPSPGIEYQFKGLSYNAVFIVELTVKSAMVQCLTLNQGGRASDFSSCPNFSFGKIR